MSGMVATYTRKWGKWGWTSYRGGGRRYIIQAGLSASGLTRVRMLEREIVEFSVSGSAFSVPPDPRAVGKKKTKFES